MGSADECFASLAALLEDGQAEAIAAELVRERTNRDEIRERAIPRAGFIGQEAEQDLAHGPSWDKGASWRRLRGQYVSCVPLTATHPSTLSCTVRC